MSRSRTINEVLKIVENWKKINNLSENQDLKLIKNNSDIIV